MEAITASLDVTPPPHLATACFGPRNTPSLHVSGCFEANLLLLREGSTLIVFISMDWFFIGPEMRGTILSRCEGVLRPDQLIVAASHTHTSPNTDRTKIGFSEVPAEYVRRIESILAGRVHDLLTSHAWEPALLRASSAPCDAAMNRRRMILWPGKRGLSRLASIYPNPDGDRDRELRLLRVEDMRGKLLSIVWNYSCHPTEWPRLRELSPDYPAAVRDALRNQAGAPIPVLFLQGFCGDLRPPSTGRWLRRASLRARLVMYLCSLVNGPCFAGFSAQQYERWSRGMVLAAQQAMHSAKQQPGLAAGLRTHRDELPLSTLGLSAQVPTMAIHSTVLGQQIVLVAVAAEAVWSYTAIARTSYKQHTVWPVAYIDSVFGYLPEADMLAEGGYEVEGYKGLFGVTGELHPGVEAVVSDCLRAQADSLTTP